MVKVFISWSGELSKQLAKTLKDWLPGVLQFVKPYFTPDDIEKGSQWHSSISNELNSSDLGIICLTKENISSPWILFEAGALSKKFDSARVCTILFNLETTDLTGPLTSIQTTSFNKYDFKKMIETINNKSNENKLLENTLNNVFDMWWPSLEKDVKSILEDKNINKNNSNDRTDKDILKELLDLTRITNKSIGRNLEEIKNKLEISEKSIYMLFERQLYQTIKIKEALIGKETGDEKIDNITIYNDILENLKKRTVIKNKD